MITTRHKELSTAFKVHPHVYYVEALSMDDATKLFSMYAFHQPEPTETYVIQSELFVHRCMGLPLALRVLGSSLRGKTNDVWEDTLRKLATIPDPNIKKVLQISYETLEDDMDKDLFLHIACFFEGEEQDFIVTLLAECDLYPMLGINNLQNRCLLHVDNNGRVMMHQSLKEMGREVVRQELPNDPGKRSRLWHHDDCFNVLKDYTGTEKVQGLMLDMRKIKKAGSALAVTMNNRAGKRSFKEYFGKTMHGNDANFHIGALEKMENLMLLQLNYVKFSGKQKKLPKKLRLLRWHGFSLKAIPADTCLEKLVVLEMRCSKLKRVWDDFKMNESLKILNLGYSVELIETPDFGGLLSLERLILEGCSSLMKVHGSIARLEKLALLDLTDCKSLRHLPTLPTSLVSLQVSGCPNLGVFEFVQSLDSVSSFSVLKKANFSWCNLFDESFSNDWSGLASLEDLALSGNNITFLPKCIQTLPRIEKLTVENCPKLQSVVGLPKQLYCLKISNNKSLEEVSGTQVLRLYYADCPKLLEVGGIYKSRSIEKVERKIVRYLGLESNAAQGMELGLQVIHERGIFSTSVSEKQIPSGCYMYEERGPDISFKVPWNPNTSRRVVGFNMCAVLSQSQSQSNTYRYGRPWLCLYIENKTKNTGCGYLQQDQLIPLNVKKFAWLSVWKCPNLLEPGDEIFITFDLPSRCIGIVTEEIRINVLYEEDEEVDGEREGSHH